jgi:hypothetical protein
MLQIFANGASAYWQSLYVKFLLATGAFFRRFGNSGPAEFVYFTCFGIKAITAKRVKAVQCNFTPHIMQVLYAAN